MDWVAEAKKKAAGIAEAANGVTRKIKDAVDPVGFAKDKAVSIGRVIGTEPAVTAARIEDIAEEFQLIEIPAVMQHRMSAPQGAELMRQWFRSPSFVLPQSWRLGSVNFLNVATQNLNTSTIKMSWVAGFPRAANALARLEQNLVTTGNAARELRRVLHCQQFLAGGRVSIGNSREAIVLHETAHLNSVAVSWGQTVDPLDCALAAFSVHMAVSGFVQPINTRGTSKTHEVEITALHFYVRDCYDFTSDREPLGSWSRNGASVVPGVPGTYFAENSIFRKWRARHGLGGDFVVFSDVLTKKLQRPINIQI